MTIKNKKEENIEEVLSLGQRLINAREAKGLSLEELASQMNLIPVVVDNLEKELFNTFEAKVYITGYLRLYCKLVGLDPNEAIALYYRDPVNRTENPRQESIASQSNNQTQLYLLIGGVILIALGASYLIFF
ncbi:MAG: helix-turn-helix domain-containing protein [Gammaproteobacteria bacterium]